MRNSLIGLLVFIALAITPLFVGQYWTGQLTNYLVYGLLAISLSLVWGYGGILCFGQAMFFGIGGYIMAVFTKGMIYPDLTSSYLGLLAAMAGSAMFALALGYFLFAGRGISGAYLAIITLAIALVLERLMNNWYALGGYNGLLNVPPLKLIAFGFSYELWDRLPTFYIILGIVAAVYFGVTLLVKSPYGLLLTAIRTHPDRLSSLGYSVLNLRLSVFSLSAAIAGLAGALFVTLDGFVSPTLIGFTLSTEALIWVAIGGKEVLLAAFLGAIFTRTAESWLSEIFGDYWILILGIVFMISVVLLPRGLLATPIEWLTKRQKPK
ncbi:branched-chain amino acid ABC transporter permease [uncultured Sneathiella sp.]|uniref:branched-chain amino acid ABC transporter permease n=1 Tax=uncultured Sneathiella sp. TaxID=879315 RepID=UPI0030D6D6A8